MKIKMKVICIRHLPTQWNKLGLLQGWRDTDILPPDELDRQSIRDNRSELDRFGPVDLICVSGLKRTRQTAELYGVKTPVEDPLLNEVDYGPYEGQPRQHLLDDLQDEWVNDPLSLAFGETMVDFQSRIRTFPAKYKNNRQVLVFSHGGWIRGLISIARHGDIRAMNKLWVDNNEIVRIDLEGR